MEPYQAWRRGFISYDVFNKKHLYSNITVDETIKSPIDTGNYSISINSDIIVDGYLNFDESTNILISNIGSIIISENGSIIIGTPASENFSMLDDFELPLSAEKWGCIGAGCTRQSIIKHSGSYALKMHGGDAIDPTIGSIAVHLSKKVVIDCWMLYDDVWASQGAFLTVFFNVTGYSLPIIIEDGYFIYRTKAFAKAHLPVDTEVVENIWYHVVVTMDFDTSKLSWVIDGESKGEVELADVQHHTVMGSSDYIREFLFGGGGTAVPNAFLDDLVITQE